MQAYFDTWAEDEVVNGGGVFPLSIYYRMGWQNNTLKA